MSGDDEEWLYMVGDKHGKNTITKSDDANDAYLRNIQLRRRILCQYYFDFGCVRTQNDG